MQHGLDGRHQQNHVVAHQLGQGARDVSHEVKGGDLSLEFEGAEGLCEGREEGEEGGAIAHHVAEGIDGVLGGDLDLALLVTKSLHDEGKLGGEDGLGWCIMLQFVSGGWGGCIMLQFVSGGWGGGEERTGAANDGAERGNDVHSALALNSQLLVLGGVLNDRHEAKVDEAAGTAVRHELGELEGGGVLEKSGVEQGEGLLKQTEGKTG